MTTTHRNMSPFKPCRLLVALLTGALTLPLLAQQSAGNDEAIRQTLERPIVNVNGQPIATAYAEVLLRQQIARGTAVTAEVRQETRRALIDQALMVQDAQSQGLDHQPLVKAQMELAARASLARVWQEHVLAMQPVSDAQLEQAYQQAVSGLGPEEFMLRHILVADAEEARQLILQLKQGANMAELAQRHTRDTDSKADGGLIGWVPQGQLVPGVVQALSRMQAGQLWEQPVQTDKGWHVLQLQERRRWSAPTLEQTRPQLLQELAQQRLQARLQALREKARID